MKVILRQEHLTLIFDYGKLSSSLFEKSHYVFFFFKSIKKLHMLLKEIKKFFLFNSLFFMNLPNSFWYLFLSIVIYFFIVIFFSHYNNRNQSQFQTNPNINFINIFY